jgi:hypothetical protein
MQSGETKVLAPVGEGAAAPKTAPRQAAPPGAQLARPR